MLHVHISIIGSPTLKGVWDISAKQLGNAAWSLL